MRIWVRVALCALAACAPGAVSQGRPYDVRVPKDAGAAPLPMLVLLHGHSASGVMQDVVFPFSSVVDTRRFVYVLPNGLRDHEGKRFWNATDACCNFDDQPVDDVAFLRAVISDVKARHAIDARKVFLVGHSNGAFMALRMACEASDVVTGVVAVAGAARDPLGPCPGAAIPVLLIHGDADPTIEYGGGTTRGGAYPGAVETGESYASRNGCALARTQLEALDLVGDATAESTREVFDACPPGAPVELWTIRGGGHIPSFNAAWPGRVFDWLVEHAP